MHLFNEKGVRIDLPHSFLEIVFALNFLHLLVLFFFPYLPMELALVHFLFLLHRSVHSLSLLLLRHQLDVSLLFILRSMTFQLSVIDWLVELSNMFQLFLSSLQLRLYFFLVILLFHLFVQVRPLPLRWSPHWWLAFYLLPSLSSMLKLRSNLELLLVLSLCSFFL